MSLRRAVRRKHQREKRHMVMTKVEYALKYHGDHDVARHKEDLVRKMRRLASRLSEEADRLESQADDSEHFSFNSLGEVQGQGADIDNLCGKLAMAIEQRKLIVWLAKDDERVEEKETC
jgi:hypothetical protein